MTKHRTIAGVVLDEEVTLTLSEVCEVCGVAETVVIEMIHEGVAEPVDTSAATPEFSGVAVTRILAARRLQRDLDVNLAGAALALDLLEEIRMLRRRRGGA